MEKFDISQVENAPISSNNDDTNEEFTPEEQKAIIRRIDRRVVVTCGVMFCFSLMDRNNLGAAAIAGMTKDLKLVSYQYSIIALIFFTTYVLIQPVANIICRKIGPRIYLAFITLAWGVVMICFGFPHSWVPMVILRLILGALEGGFFPACLYLISTWYTRYEMQKRFALFYLLGCFASALAGILAYGLMQMDGVGGLRGWRWIFIMEGLLTTIVGFLGYVVLVDFPDRAASKSWRFLNERECAFILRRIANDRDDAELEPFNLKRWASAGLDIKVWCFAFLFFLNGATAYAMSFFLPIILRNNIGFSLAASQCLVAPPYAFAAILMYASAWASDKWRLRAPFIILNAVFAAVGLPMLGFASSNAARYIGIFIVTAGVTANFPGIMAYQANNIRGQWNRAFASAALVGLGSVGGIAGALVFRSQDAPHYRPGVVSVMVFNASVILLTCLMTTYFHLCNKKADRGDMIIEGLTGFRYTL